MASVLELQLQHQSFQWIFRTDILQDWLVWYPFFQGTLKSLLKHHSSKASILWCSDYFMDQLLHTYMTTGKASGGGGVPAELFQILKDDAVKKLHSICQQIWETQQWPQDRNRSVFILIQKKGNAKDCSNYHTSVLISHPSRAMFIIFQASLQQYVNWELPDVQAGFRKGRGTRKQIANIRWIIEKAREFQKSIYFWLIDYAEAFDCVDHSKLWKILKWMGIPDHLTCLLRNLHAGQEATDLVME